MSEGISLLNINNHMDNKKLSLFQAQTTYFQVNPSLAMRCHESSPDAVPVILRGSKTSKTTIGRGHDATIKIGKANKRVSREHVVIEHKPQIDGFELTILSPNGALVDHIVFIEGEHVPVVEGTTIEIVGTKIIFQVPDEKQSVAAEDMQDIIEPLLTTEENKKKKNEKAIIPMMTTNVAIEQKTGVMPTTATTTNTTITTATTSKKNNTTAINHIIKSTASKLKETSRNNAKKPMTLEDEIIQALVYSRKSTMTCADITKRLQAGSQSAENVHQTLIDSAVVGCIKRLGITADGSPKEDLYYYKPELDTDQERRKQYLDVGRSARKCAMKDTQYFFKVRTHLSFLGRIRMNVKRDSCLQGSLIAPHKKQIPPNHKSTAKSKKRNSATSTGSQKAKHSKTEEDDRDAKSTSSGDVSDMEVYELFKDV